MADTAAPRAVYAGRASAVLAEYGVYLAVAALVVFNVAFTANFWSAANLRTQLVQAAPVVIVAIGMALVIGTEGIDLSVGAVMALVAALIPLYLGYGLPAACTVSLLAGAVSGLFGGTLVAWLGIQPIVATLALLVGLRGLALVVAHGRLKEVHDPALLNLGSGTLLGVPVIVWFAAGAAAAGSLLVSRTTFGRQLVAIGGNRSAATLAGLPVRRILVLVYVLCGVLAALAGVLATARLGAGDPADVGQLMELSAITAVVVGDTPLTGGKVRVLGTVAGALLMQLVRATLIKHDLPDSSAQMIQAALIVVAVYTARERSTR